MQRPRLLRAFLAPRLRPDAAATSLAPRASERAAAAVYEAARAIRGRIEAALAESRRDSPSD